MGVSTDAPVLFNSPIDQVDPVPPSSNSPIHVSVWPVVLAGFTAFLDLYATQPLLPLLISAFDATHFAVSLTITAPTIAVALAAPVAGRVADLVGQRRVIVGSAFALAAATALAATATSLRWFVVWRFVQGLFTPGVFAVVIAYVHDAWPGSRVGRATAAYVSGTVTGGFCGRALVGLVAGSAGWPVAFVTLSAVNLAAAVALAVWLPPDARGRERRRVGHRQSVAALLGNRQLLATNAVGFCVLFSQVSVFTYVTFHLSGAPYRLGTAALGWLFVVYLVGAAVTAVAGRFIDACGHRASLAAGMSIGATGALLTLAPALIAIIAGLALVGTGVFIAQATASSHIGAVTADDRGLAVGIYSACYYLGGSLGGALPAAFWNAGGWAACVALVLTVQAITVALALGWWRVDLRAAAPVADGLSQG
jgi:predicted MFS family arabinose efflux permease